MTAAMNRREFLEAGALGAGAMILGTAATARAQQDQWPPKMPPARIYTVYLGRTGGIYLSRPNAEIQKFKDYLVTLQDRLGDVEFIGGELIPPEDVQTILPRLKDADGVLLFHLSGHGGDAPTNAMATIIETGIPAAVFSQPFSGHGWMYFPRWQKQGKKVVLLPSSDWSEIDRVVGLMRVAPHMKNTRILVVRGPLGTTAACDPEKVKQKLGAEMITVSVDETVNAHNAIPIEDAQAEAKEHWISKAKNIVEPTKEEIVNSARYYLATKKLMIEKGAQATTSSNCMGAPAKGCLTYSKLNDLGLVGACEGDMDSTLTMLIFKYAFGIPGFITDPVFDTAENALIHFHCTCATKMAGPKSERLPFTIRTQSDSERGVSLDVEMPIGQVVTCAKFIDLDKMLISTGEIFKVTHDELGCRTQFWTRVKDARSMFHNWGAGVLEGGTMTLLHRVVFFGDHTQSIKNLGILMGFDVIEEA
ncbi:MAG: hypothetical protein JW720_03720 [Sedimentisphaerales bacterium]|nr:hypothetical protein [Sedimentisphaerales bacterium]